MTGICLMIANQCIAEERKWNDEAELSVVSTDGNSETKTISAKNILKYKFNERLLGRWKAGALKGESDGEREAEKYFSEIRLDYLLTEKIYTFGNVGWLKDTFSGIDSRYYVGPGMGYNFLKGPSHFLLGEAGLNYVNEDYTDDTDNDFIAGRLFALYEYHFTAKNKFSQSVEYLHAFDDSENYSLNSETALISALNGNLSLKASYIINYDNKPVPDTLEKKDSILAMALVANF